MDAKTEVRSFAVVPKTEVTNLANALRALCASYGKFKVHELALQVPLQGGKETTVIQLSRRLNAPTRPAPFVEPQLGRWVVQHEGLPMVGAAVVDLPAAVRHVCESHCQSNDLPEFWQCLGAKLFRELVKEGNEYHCVFEGHEIKALLFQTMKIETPGALEKAQSTGKYVLDVTTRVAEGQHVEGARVLGLFAQKLAPAVTLQPALLPRP